MLKARNSRSIFRVLCFYVLNGAVSIEKYDPTVNGEYEEYLGIPMKVFRLHTPTKMHHRRLGGPQDRSGLVRKISPLPGFDPRTVQPAASRYTELSRCLLII
jgi:hypothetical protein